MKKVLVLAGGYDQIALINELKREGCHVILADYYENPPAKAYAEKHYQISTLDEEAVYELALSEKVDIVTTACTDQALLTVARVSERLNLQTYISAETARNVTDKVYMKKHFEENNIPTAKVVILKDKSSWENDICHLPSFPLVVKPCDCNSSKGVEYVRNSDELYTAVNNAFLMSRSGKVIIEQFIDGRELSVDVWVDKEGVKILAVSETEKLSDSVSSFTIYKSKYPVRGVEQYNDKIASVAKDIARAFNLYDCPMLIQVLVKDGEIYVIEFSARMGGGTKYKLIEYISGLNIMKIYVNRILGITDQIVNPDQCDSFVELDYLYTYNGIITEFKGFDKCINQGIIKEYFQYKTVGSEITSRKTSSDRAAGILLTAKTSKELAELRKKAMDNIDICCNEKSILYKECFML